MYQTIASGGFRTPLRAIREVTTQDGRPLKRYPLAVEQAFPPEPMYLLTAAMQDVVREGTGAGAEELAAAGDRASPARPAPPTSSATPGSPASPATGSASCGSATTTTAPRASPAPPPRCRCGAS